MILSDVSIKRPVFASVLAMMMAVFGLFAFDQLSTREYPDITPAQISIRTNYPGASADIVETRITQILEGEVNGVEGIKSMRSSSINGRSTINVEFGLEYDIDKAANDVRDKVSRVLNRLPQEAEDPQVSKSDSDSRPVVYISVISEQWNNLEITDYAERYLKDRFAVVPGVSAVNILGGGESAMRIWLDKRKILARGLTVMDVVDALRNENIELPAGRIESDTREFPVRISRSYQNESDFRAMVIARGEGDQLVRLGDVAEVKVDKANTRRIFVVNGSDSMSIGIVKQSTANTVEVLEGVKEVIAQLEDSLPDDLYFRISGDASVFIRAAIDNVYGTIAMTIVLVALVLWLFLGNWRALLIPVVCIPLSLLGSFVALWWFGYTVNLITLLAMVLSIGMVVDDAIVVLENIHRRIEQGEPPLLAAFNGARQVSFAVIATTVVLIAVFVPVGLLQSNTGQVFSELAVAISSAVICSTILALSMVPMLCSKLLHKGDSDAPIIKRIEGGLNAISLRYQGALQKTLSLTFIPLVLVLCAGIGSYFMYERLDKEYVPKEDQGNLMALIFTEEGTSAQSMRETLSKLNKPFVKYIEDGSVTRVLFTSPFFGSTSPNTAFSRITYTDWNKRDYSIFEAQKEMQQAWAGVPGVRTIMFSPNGLSRSGGNSPVEFVIQGDNYENLIAWRDIILDRARASGLFTALRSDLKENQQQIKIEIDRDRAAVLGVTINDIGSTLQALMAEQEISQYVRDGLEYPVILSVKDDQRDTSADINNVYVRSRQSGELVSLANFVSVKNQADIASLERYNRLRAVTISGGLAEGVSIGEGLAFLEQTATEFLPEYASVDYKGESLEYKESSGNMVFLFGLALIVLFLVMAAQFESFIHPSVILFTVPLAIMGGLLGLYLTQSSFSIFGQIGFLMLIGIATKNGILLVEFINQLRDQGKEFNDAILEACKIRLRPVIMTTLSTAVGALPLVFATGPGEASRNVLGIVIFAGVMISALLTLFVIPGFYKLLARGTGSPERIAKELETLQDE
jgi:multidrug efflux pump